MATTAWGEASLVEEIQIKQNAGSRSFTTFVQLLENDDGEPLVRFAYATDGTARRGPVTLRKGDLEKLRRGLAKTPRLRDALGLRDGA